MNVKRQLVWLVMVLMLGLGMTACGGGNDQPSSGSDPALTETAAALVALTPLPTYPPTWTPVPTQPTATPRGTLAYTYVRPTATPFPTRTPTPVPPTATPAPTRLIPTLAVTVPVSVQAQTLDIPAAILNQAGQAEFAAGTSAYLAGAPGFNFQPPDTVIVLVNMRTDPANPASAANLVIRATVALEEGRITLTQIGTNRLGDTTVTQLPLVDSLLDTLESRIDTALQDFITTSIPGAVSYAISAVEVKETSLTLTVSATVQGGAQGGTQGGADAVPTTAPVG